MEMSDMTERGVFVLENLTMEELQKLNNATHINYDTEEDVLPVEDQDRKRDWFLTINAGAECRKNGKVAYETLEDYLVHNFHSLVYACWDEEIGDTGNNHLHIYVSSANGKSFSKMKKLFPGARIEPKKGSAFYAANYVKKPAGLELKGKEKSHTQIKPPIEIGDFDNIAEKGLYNKDGTLIKKEKVDINKKLSNLVEQYNTLEEIAVADSSTYNLYHKTLAILMDVKQKNKLLADNIAIKHIAENGEEFYTIDRKVAYVYGLNGAGKTYAIYKKYGFSNVGLVTFNKDNHASFDNYHNEDVLLVDDFCGNIPFSTLQHMTDSYIKPLDARYQDKKSYYSKCIFTSNIPFDRIYLGVKEQNLDRYNSMLRRFTGGVWEVYQDRNGKQYITQHTEFIPNDLRFGDKFKNIESPLSKDFTVVSPEEFEKIQGLDKQLEYAIQNNLLVETAVYNFTANDNGTVEMEVVKTLSCEEENNIKEKAAEIRQELNKVLSVVKTNREDEEVRKRLIKSYENMTDIEVVQMSKIECPF